MPLAQYLIDYFPTTINYIVEGWFGTESQSIGGRWWWWWWDWTVWWQFAGEHVTSDTYAGELNMTIWNWLNEIVKYYFKQTTYFIQSKVHIELTFKIITQCLIYDFMLMLYADLFSRGLPSWRNYLDLLHLLRFSPQTTWLVFVHFNLITTFTMLRVPKLNIIVFHISWHCNLQIYILWPQNRCV